jgi:methanethiol S-methyltransferase
MHLLAFLLLLLYFAIHSLLAAESVKRWFAARLGTSFRAYRLGYNVVSIVLFCILLYWMFSLDDAFLLPQNIFTKSAASILCAIGTYILLGSLWQYDLGEFSGIKQWQQKNNAPQHSELRISGLNAIVRHPLYLGTLLLLIGFFLYIPKISLLLVFLSVLIYLPFGIYWEEQKLLRQFGTAYEDYKKRVKALLPGIW